MISIYPKFYNDFTCKGNRCIKTCCQRWEIDIDNDTVQRYRAMSGELGQALREAMAYNEVEDSYHFKLNNEGKCFLLKDGWCRVVLEKGEDGLCNICHMHPRFFKYLEDFEFCGVGLCCEKSCELLDQSSLEAISSNIVDTDETTRNKVLPNFLLPLKKEITTDDGEVISSESTTVVDILSELGITIEPEQLEFKPNPEKMYYKTILESLSKTEPIDDVWSNNLVYLQEHLDAVVSKAKDYVKAYNKLFFSHLYQYILYRQLDKASEYYLESVLQYAWESTEYIFLQSALTGKPLLETALWSEQIEYDTENVDILLKIIDN